jgi:hypothetical protein
MDAASKAFGGLVDYQVGEVTAAATFYMAEIYANFGQTLRESERPADLGAGALKDYEQQLADAAHPVEEKAIAIHEKNLELMRRGLNNPWTQKSLDRLAALKPDTYARAEISSGFLGSLERYVYQPPPRAIEAALGSPTAPAAAPPAGPTAGPAAGQGAPPAEGAAAPPIASGTPESAIGQSLTIGAANASPH